MRLWAHFFMPDFYLDLFEIFLQRQDHGIQNIQENFMNKHQE